MPPEATWKHYFLQLDILTLVNNDAGVETVYFASVANVVFHSPSYGYDSHRPDVKALSAA
jgi:hypothetical protein